MTARVKRVAIWRRSTRRIWLRKGSGGHIYKDIEKLFAIWSKKSRDHHITKKMLRKILEKENYYFSRPQLLAMMRIVDEGRSGTIVFREFMEFCKFPSPLHISELCTHLLSAQNTTTRLNCR